MKNKLVPSAFLILLLTSCSPKNSGFITLVNSGVSTAQIAVDGRKFTILPANHITKELSAGQHEVSLDGGAPISVMIELGGTTIFDSTGLSCYIVADFAQRTRGGNPMILEKYEHQQVSMIKGKMAAVLGAALPKKLSQDEPAMRIHQVDCGIINDNIAIINELEDL